MDIESLVIDFIIGGLLIASALALATLVGPLFGGIFAGAPIRVGASIFLAGLHEGPEFATEMTRGAVFSMFGNILFIIALYFSLPKFGLYKGFIISGTIFSIAVILMIKLWPWG